MNNVIVYILEDEILTIPEFLLMLLQLMAAAYAAAWAAYQALRSEMRLAVFPDNEGQSSDEASSVPESPSDLTDGELGERFRTDCSMPRANAGREHNRVVGYWSATIVLITYALSVSSNITLWFTGPAALAAAAVLIGDSIVSITDEGNWLEQFYACMIAPEIPGEESICWSAFRTYKSAAVAQIATLGAYLLAIIALAIAALLPYVATPGLVIILGTMAANTFVLLIWQTAFTSFDGCLERSN